MIAERNGVEMDDFVFTEEAKLHKSKPSHHSASSAPSNTDFLKNKTIFKNTIIFMILFGTTEFSTFLINYHMKYVGGSYYFNRLVKVAAWLVSNLGAPAIVRRLSLKASWLIALSAVILFTIPLNMIDVSNLDNAGYVLLFVFLACLGLGGCVVLEFSTGAMLFPSLFTAEAFSTSNIIGPAASILSP